MTAQRRTAEARDPGRSVHHTDRASVGADWLRRYHRAFAALVARGHIVAAPRLRPDEPPVAFVVGTLFGTVETLPTIDALEQFCMQEHGVTP